MEKRTVCLRQRTRINRPDGHTNAQKMQHYNKRRCPQHIIAYGLIMIMTHHATNIRHPQTTPSVSVSLLRQPRGKRVLIDSIRAHRDAGMHSMRCAMCETCTAKTLSTLCVVFAVSSAPHVRATLALCVILRSATRSERTKRMHVDEDIL